MDALFINDFCMCIRRRIHFDFLYLMKKRFPETEQSGKRPFNTPSVFEWQAQ